MPDTKKEDKSIPPSEEQLLKKQKIQDNNVVISIEALQSVYDYMNTKPRNEVNKHCTTLENVPTLKAFLAQVESEGIAL